VGVWIAEIYQWSCKVMFGYKETNLFWWNFHYYAWFCYSLSRSDRLYTSRSDNRLPQFHQRSVARHIAKSSSHHLNDFGVLNSRLSNENDVGCGAHVYRWLCFLARAYPRRLDSEKPQLMMFAYADRQFETKSGLKAGTGSTVFYRSEAFKSNAKNMPFAMTSPTGVVLACNVPQQMYCHLLCGLYRSRDVEQVGAIFAYMIVEPFRLLERVQKTIPLLVFGCIALFYDSPDS